jgi:hypothetical protein
VELDPADDDAGVASARTNLTVRSRVPSSGLERFWPSRRIHTFDERCR